ncbi:hypothetical protein [Actinomadura sp. CNU-125]|uniref:hypothetical protein n=1 Tax=Actinomadura sp. CNU-125 TaxID=1904961 RepID=UPI001177B4DB|nr:hypothetical protein [Actinomadura sp. CNU-125]
MAEQTSNDLVEQAKWIAKAATGLETLINERADAKAEAALVRAHLEADEQIKEVQARLGGEVRRQEDLIEELRRQLSTCARNIDRHTERVRALAEALGVPAYTPWELLIAKVRKQGDTCTCPHRPTNPLSAQDGERQ